jgi:PAS domain S-box-containing protein
MTVPHDDEDTMLRSVVRQNAESIFLARQRAERDLLRAKEELEARGEELAASLALMQATLEATADGIVATDEHDCVTAYNAQFLAIWGFADDVILGREHGPLRRAIADQQSDPAAFLAGVERILNEAPAESADVLELADGRVIERVTRVPRIDGRSGGRVWSYRDITARARAEAVLREAKAEAETANRAKSSFLAMMSHELRTPLNAIAGYTELLDLEIPGPVTTQQREALARIHASQRRLLTLIDEVLTHARLETGKLEFDVTDVLVAEAFVAAESIIAPQAWAKGVTLTVPRQTAGLVLRADADKVQQILTNLLSNAVKFTAAGGHVEMGCAARNGGVEIVVRDDGVGIAPDQLEVIFEPFVQVRSELTRTAEGTGLGLAISRALARGMGGDVTVASESGKGSAFTVRLPAAA